MGAKKSMMADHLLTSPPFLNKCLSVAMEMECGRVLLIELCRT
jgi:hypothetical protein